jgi:uncharacterized membrane protein YccC
MRALVGRVRRPRLDGSYVPARSHGQASTGGWLKLVGDRWRSHEGSNRFTKRLDQFLKGDVLGLHLAANIFVATAILWLLLRRGADLDPIWAISSMIAASDPQVTEALKTFRGRTINALLGCAVGVVFLVVAGSSAWKLPLALSVTVLLSTYVVRVHVMWRQAPITAGLIIAAGLTHHSELTAVEVGLRRVGEVLLGCVVGVAVSWFMSKLWSPPPPTTKDPAAKS